MALTDILSAIDQKTDDEVTKIVKEGQEKANALQADYEKKLHDKKEEILKNLKATADRKVSQASFQVQSQVSGKILTKKREVIDEVFKQALDKLSSLNDAATKKILVNLIKALPKIEEGEIVPAKGVESAVKAAASEAGTKYKVSSDTTKGKGGFVFKSDGLIIDNTWEQIVDRQQDLLETDIANILFNG